MLCGLPAHESIQEAAWLGYLRAVSLLVASAQHVKNFNSVKRPLVTSEFERDGSPPKKRPSLDNIQSDSILISTGVTERTTSLDAFLMSVHEDLNQRGEDEFIYLPASSRRLYRLVENALCRMFDTRYITQEPQPIRFPELRFMLPSVPRGAIMDQPKLALTLLSPFVAVVLPSEDPATQRSRLETMAECLLRLSRKFPEATAKAMEDRAFEILYFDANDMIEGYRRMEILRQHATGTSRLVDHILQAMQAVQGRYSEDHLAESSEYAKLLSLLFYKSLEAHDWGRALAACKNNPSRAHRLDHLKRLVTSMVDSGALSNLVAMCSSHGEDTEQQDFAHGMDLYGIAVETLGQAGYRDWYTHRANGSESLSDYQGALYALHASRNEWRRAAQAMDLRYMNAVTALSLNSSQLMSSSTGLAMDNATISKRTRLILDDLVLAATGGYNALCLVENVESRFIISGENGKFPTLPATKIDDEASIGVKRQRARIPQHNDEEDGKESTRDEADEYRLVRYRNSEDLQTRAIVAMGVRRLWIEGVIEKPLADLLSERDEPGMGLQLLIRALFMHGNYDLGLILSLQTKETMPGRAEGRGIFQEALGFLLCDHLVPLAIGVEGGSKPSLAHIHAALDAASNNMTSPVLLGRASKKNENPLDTSIRFAAMALLERLTTKYTTAERPLAREVAECFIVEQKVAALPQWLESLLTHGSDLGSDHPGLFAKRPKTGSGYLGDPSALLDLYIVSGMYHLACDLVCSIFGMADRRATSTAMRLPEKGETDFVPYGKIDTLYNLVDLAIENGDIDDTDYRTTVLSARERMVQALGQHLDRMEISEAGLKSARILSTA